ncbi:hypothetical protein B0T13DRAFT_392345, partial [Neurospora crassa]
ADVVGSHDRCQRAQATALPLSETSLCPAIYFYESVIVVDWPMGSELEPALTFKKRTDMMTREESGRSQSQQSSATLFPPSRQLSTRSCGPILTKFYALQTRCLSRNSGLLGFPVLDVMARDPQSPYLVPNSYDAYLVMSPTHHFRSICAF